MGRMLKGIEQSCRSEGDKGRGPRRRHLLLGLVAGTKTNSASANAVLRLVAPQ
jgi:hypothetical protein